MICLSLFVISLLIIFDVIIVISFISAIILITFFADMPFIFAADCRYALIDVATLHTIAADFPLSSACCFFFSSSSPRRLSAPRPLFLFILFSPSFFRHADAAAAIFFDYTRHATLRYFRL